MDYIDEKYSGSLMEAADVLREMASYSRLLILKNLIEKGPMTYSTLKTISKFEDKKESGKFAYHLRNLGSQKLVYQTDDKKYGITNRGTVFLVSSVSAIGLTTEGNMSNMLSKIIKEAYTINLIEPQLDKITKNLQSSLKDVDKLKKEIEKLKAGRIGTDNTRVTDQIKSENKIPKTKQEAQTENFIEKYKLSKDEIKLSEYLISVEPNESNFNYKIASKKIGLSQVKIKDMLGNPLNKGAFKKVGTFDEEDNLTFYKQVL